ncbi:MAG: OsmC family protein [Candidatus Thorarchaeota archaeon]|nr:OsmC family protein [Candidatus Thorarchaeota archaeon]
MTDVDHKYEMDSKWVRDKIVTMEIKGKPTLEIATPLDFWPDAPVDMISPEDLFLGAAVTCYGVSMHGVAKRFHTEYLDFSVKGVGTLTKGEYGWEFAQITLDVEVLVAEEAHMKKMEKVAERSHRYCLVANSMKCPIHLNYVIKVKE